MSQVSDACGGGDAGIALVPGSLRGYRTWQPSGRWVDVPDGGLPLTSITRRHVVWSPTLTARCEPNAAPAPASAAPDHHAPHKGCTCGIYGWYSPTDTGMTNGRVFGAIEASGLVLMGERGFRAEKAKIAAVVTWNRHITAACAPADIAVYRRRRDLLRDYPPEDLSVVLGDTREPWLPAMPPTPVPPRSDGLALLALWGDATLLATVFTALPATSALVTAAVTQLLALGLLAARRRR